MTTKTTRWVFFIALLLLLPLPFVQPELCWLPVARVLFVASAEAYLYVLGSGLASTDMGIGGLAATAAVWAVLLWLVASAYVRWSAHWPSKVRGAVMSLFIFSLLIIFSSIPVYRSLAPAEGRISFLQVYD